MRKPVHPFAQKYSASRLPQIKLTVSAVPAHKRGVSRSSRTLGTGCDGRGSVRRNFCARRMMQLADGEVVWSWRSDAGAKFAGLNESGDRRWQPSMVTGESTKDTVKTIAQGRPDDPARTCGYAACFFAARGPWVRRAPGLPCALCLRRDTFDASPGRFASREREGASTSRFEIRFLKIESDESFGRFALPRLDHCLARSFGRGGEIFRFDVIWPLAASISGSIDPNLS
jgi:hypothetical protein